MFVAWLAHAAHAGACDAAALQDAIEDAESSFSSMDASGFDDALRRARTSLGCAEAALTPVQCAGFHRVMALDAFLRSDEPTAILDFAAMRATQPGYALPDDVAPEGHPLRDTFQKATEFASSGTFALPPIAEGWTNVDGQRSSAAPSGRPFVVQWFDDGGAPRVTGHVPVGGKIPTWPAPVEKKSAVSPFVWAGAATAAAGLGAYGAAFGTRGSYDDAVASGESARISSLHGTTNALTLTGIGLLAGGAALVVVGVL